MDPALPSLTPDELLSTTRSVRRRFDFDREVDPSVIDECLRLALQAPTGSNAQGWRFVVVTDEHLRRELGDVYRKGWTVYEQMATSAAHIPAGDDAVRAETQRRVMSSAHDLAMNIHRAPVLVVACLAPRPDRRPIPVALASQYASVFPAVWSLMLAARSRGLGSCLTTMHLFHEEEAAELLGIPFEEVAQVALIPIAHTKGTQFRAAQRLPLEEVVHRERWLARENQPPQ
jgi:nitroreductase